LSAKSAALTACAILTTAIAPAGAAESCTGIDHARQTVYIQYAKLVADDVKALSKSNPDVPFNTKMEDLGRSYARAGRFGDVVALRKLIGLGLFTAYATKRPPLDITFKLVCELARRDLQLTLDPLTCAVIAVDGPRRKDRNNRMLARQMIDRARARIANDPNGPAGRKMVDDLAPVVTACSVD
jgi:hypothetical protein